MVFKDSIANPLVSDIRIGTVFVTPCHIKVGGREVYCLSTKFLSVCQSSHLFNHTRFPVKNWPRGYKTYFILNSAEHDIFLLINVEMPTIVGISTFMSRKNSTLGLSEHEKCLISLYFHAYEHLKFHAQLS